MKKEETLCPLATCLHPVHSAHLEAPPFPFGKIFLMFGPVDNLTTLAMKSVNCRRWLFVLFVFYQPAHFEETIHFIFTCFLISGQVWLVTSEASYIRSLSIAVDHFMMSPELCECLGTQERQWLFSKLPDVKEVSERWIKNNYNFAILKEYAFFRDVHYPCFYSPHVHRFLQDLEHRLEGDILRFDVCDIVLDHCPALRRVYLPYVTNQAYQEQTYQRKL